MPSPVSQQEVLQRSQEQPASANAGGPRHMGISLVTLEEIVPNAYQPRRDFDDEKMEELAQSIRENGLIQPLVVRKCASGYQLIAGERRLRAAKIAGLKHVPIVIRKSTDRESLEVAIIENVQRENLNCIDEALAYLRLSREFSLTQEDIAKRVGKDRATVSNSMRLLKLPEPVIDDLRRGVISYGHGKALLSLEDSGLVMQARTLVVEKAMSVRDTENLVEMLKAGKAENGTSGKESVALPLSPLKMRLDNISQELTRKWSTKVELRGGERRGKIVFHYATRQDLDRILSAMQNDNIWPVH
ncbi:MAG: hypothetical protein A2583_06130 [Bdellovibrionales bacterium RIFOXYD1_FULL_53_11]|nr:MAG: hypothetical protein A2583_06130 [Bdellovibrionales bacterium RIFOXYD1_FULL_53_11]